MTTTTPQQRIEADVKAAMKSGEKEKLSTLRMLLTEIKNERIRRGGEVDEAGFVSLVRKSIKQREESVSQYRTGGPRGAGRQGGVRERRCSRPTCRRRWTRGRSAPPSRRSWPSSGLSGTGGHGADHEGVMARFGTAADGATINRIAREVLAKNAG